MFVKLLFFSSILCQSNFALLEVSLQFFILSLSVSKCFLQIIYLAHQLDVLCSNFKILMLNVFIAALYLFALLIKIVDLLM